MVNVSPDREPKNRNCLDCRTFPSEFALLLALVFVALEENWILCYNVYCLLVNYEEEGRREKDSYKAYRGNYI